MNNNGCTCRYSPLCRLTFRSGEVRPWHRTSGSSCGWVGCTYPDHSAHNVRSASPGTSPLQELPPGCIPVGSWLCPFQKKYGWSGCFMMHMKLLLPVGILRTVQSQDLQHWPRSFPKPSPQGRLHLGVPPRQQDRGCRNT